MRRILSIHFLTHIQLIVARSGDLPQPSKKTALERVHTVNRYDKANRLLELSHTMADDTLLARYEYTLDNIGNRVAVTETVLYPEIVSTIDSFLEENGMLVLEAESGQVEADSTHSWISQTVQTGYDGDAYLRALPDIGERLSTEEMSDGAQANFPVQISNPADYTIWLRGMAPDAGGDSAYVSLNGSPNSAQAVTGFTNEWSWSRQTMSNTSAALSLNNSGLYTLSLSMREDGLRIDKILLITDTNYIPTGNGPVESPQQIISDTAPSQLVTQTIYFELDPLYRLIKAEYDGAYTAVYQYTYDTIGNRTNYTTTTDAISYQYDLANRLVESVETNTGITTTYDWDDAGRLITTTVGNDVTRVYTYSQDGDMTAALVNNLLTTFVYDGNGNRLQMSVAGNITTYTLDYAANFQPLFEQGGSFADTKHYLYGNSCIGEQVNSDLPDKEWRYYHRDGQPLVRQTTNSEAHITLTWTYSPEGAVLLGEEGPVTNLDCGATYDWSTGLIFKNGNYFDPNTGIWIAMGGMVIWNNRQPGARNRHQRRQSKKWLLLLFLLIIILVLAGCDPTPTPIPDPTVTCTPEGIPTSMPFAPEIITRPPQEPLIPTAPPTVTPPPTNTPPSQPSHTSQAGLEFISRFEAFESDLYEDSAGHCTVGYGHLVHFGMCNDTDSSEQPFVNGISHEAGLDLFRSDINIYEEAVNNSVTVPLAQHQYDALISFAFNIGANGFKNSDLVTYLNQNNYNAVPEQMRLWTNFGDAGLVRRREFEITLFKDGIYRTDW